MKEDTTSELVAKVTPIKGYYLEIKRKPKTRAEINRTYRDKLKLLKKCETPPKTTSSIINQTYYNTKEIFTFSCTLCKISCSKIDSHIATDEHIKILQIILKDFSLTTQPLICMHCKNFLDNTENSNYTMTPTSNGFTIKNVTNPSRGEYISILKKTQAPLCYTESDNTDYKVNNNFNNLQSTTPNNESVIKDLYQEQDKCSTISTSNGIKINNLTDSSTGKYVSILKKTQVPTCYVENDNTDNNVNNKFNKLQLSTINNESVITDLYQEQDKCPAISTSNGIKISNLTNTSKGKYFSILKKTQVPTCYMESDNIDNNVNNKFNNLQLSTQNNESVITDLNQEQDKCSVISTSSGTKISNLTNTSKSKYISILKKTQVPTCNSISNGANISVNTKFNDEQLTTVKTEMIIENVHREQEVDSGMSRCNTFEVGNSTLSDKDTNIRCLKISEVPLCDIQINNGDSKLNNLQLNTIKSELIIEDVDKEPDGYLEMSTCNTSKIGYSTPLEIDNADKQKMEQEWLNQFSEIRACQKEMQRKKKAEKSKKYYLIRKAKREAELEIEMHKLQLKFKSNSKKQFTKIPEKSLNIVEHSKILKEKLEPKQHSAKAKRKAELEIELKNLKLKIKNINKEDITKIPEKSLNMDELSKISKRTLQKSKQNREYYIRHKIYRESILKLTSKANSEKELILPQEKPERDKMPLKKSRSEINKTYYNKHKFKHQAKKESLNAYTQKKTDQIESHITHPVEIRQLKNDTFKYPCILCSKLWLKKDLHTATNKHIEILKRTLTNFSLNFEPLVCSACKAVLDKEILALFVYNRSKKNYSTLPDTKVRGVKKRKVSLHNAICDSANIMINDEQSSDTKTDTSTKDIDQKQDEYGIPFISCGYDNEFD